jgi:hypothetical protein
MTTPPSENFPPVDRDTAPEASRPSAGGAPRSPQLHRRVSPRLS